jgi:uncharacterized protein YwgA
MFKRNVFNKILLLILIRLADHNSNGINGATRIQKLVFAAEFNGRNQKLPTFDYKFIRWHYGPYCDELKRDLEFLNTKGLVTNNNNSYSLTPQGNEVVDDIYNTINESGILNTLELVVRNYSTLPLVVLLRQIYEQYNIEEDYNKGDVILPIQRDEEMSEYV